MVDIFNLINFLSNNWVIFLFLISIIAVLIGRIFYRISIFQPIEEIAYKQENYRREHELQQFKGRMVIRNLELGNSFLDAHNLKAAKTEFEKTLSLDSTNIEAHIGLIKSEVFQPILEKDPAHYDPEIAEKRLNIILKEKPNDKHALLFLGSVYITIDDKLALKYFNEALISDPKFAIAYSNIAYVYAMQNKNDDALANMEKAANPSKWNSTIINNLGYQYLIKDQYEKAIKQFELLLKFNPHFLIAYWNVSNAYRMAGNFQLAYKRQKKLIELLEDKDVTSLKINQGKWFFNTESDKGAIFNDLVEKTCYSYYSMALTCYFIDSKEEAHEFIDKVQKLGSCDKISSKDFLNFNINCLQKKDSNLINKLDEFKANIPNLDFCK